MSTAKLPPENLYANLVRSDFWFCDGNIVIIAGLAAFKVHRGQLERHSEVFSSLFSLPQPSDQDLVDGCSCVELQDCPSDVFYFLSALYDGLYFKKPRATDFPVIAAVLRLSSKYLVEHLRQRCLAQLCTDWPSKIADWDARERRFTDPANRYAPREYTAHPILIIELALAIDLPAILPAALYDLSRYGPSKIMAGTVSPLTPFECYVRQKTGAALPLERCVRLSRELLGRTLQGREASQRYMAGFIAKEMHCRQPAAECLHRAERASHGEGAGEARDRACHESFFFIMLNTLRSVGGIACGRDADPLYTLIQALDMLSRTDFTDGQRQCGLRLCPVCRAEFAQVAAKAREEFWMLLPQWFGFVDGKKQDSVLDMH